MVEMAKSWKIVKPQAWLFSPWQHVRHPIPQGNKGLASVYTVTEEMMKKNNLERLEHVTVVMNVEHQRRGDLSVELRSPTGMVSHIATHRRKDNAHTGYVDWEFMSVAHWGEDGVGDWTVVVKDTKVDDNKGTFTDWRLKLWGESIDGSKQELLPLPNENDDADHDREDANVGTTSVAVPTVTGQPEGNPTGHIDRPNISKASSTTSASPSATDISEAEDDTATTSSSTPSPTASQDSNFLPRPFPTFGASKTTQYWIYGSAILIVGFLSAIGGWWWYMRRKRARWMSRDEYGFEMVEGNDADEDVNGAAAGAGGVRRNKRAGELYDAFAEGSDEDTPFGLDSEDESDVDDHRSGEGGKERYKDVDQRA
jgi:kexin